MESNAQDESPAAVVDTMLAELAPDLARVGRVGKSHRGLGFGTIYSRGRIWWIRYSVRGQRVRESTKSTRENDAIKLLRKRIEECGKGRRLDPASEGRIRMAALFDALGMDYRNNGRRSLATLGFRLAPLRAAFGNVRAIDVTGVRITRYAAQRLTAGKSRATVNRELAALRRAFALAAQREQLSNIPPVTLFREDNARQGFVSAAQFAAITTALPDHIKDVARFAYLTGWRRREITSLEWNDVDPIRGVITLRREHSKNGQPRNIPFSVEPDNGSATVFDAVAEVIRRRLLARRPDGEGARYVFHRGGHRLCDFRGAWMTACRAAGVPSVLFHDLRRSAVRNLVDAGIDQRVAMAITGHRTPSIFARYRIVVDDDVRAALKKVRLSACREDVPNDTQGLQ
jgi:integrase